MAGSSQFVEITFDQFCTGGKLCPVITLHCIRSGSYFPMPYMYVAYSDIQLLNYFFVIYDTSRKSKTSVKENEENRFI